MGSIVSTIFDSVNDVVEGFVEAVRTGFTNLIWEDPNATGDLVLSDFAQFGLVFLGVSIAIGIAYTMIRMVRV